jgi:hypothetical protein
MKWKPVTGLTAEVFGPVLGRTSILIEEPPRPRAPPK